MLEIKGLNISQTQPDGPRHLIRDLSITLPGQGITALIGPSGCGKSSVLKWLSGILPKALSASGALYLDGCAIARPHPDLCYQPQNDALLPWATIADNAALGLCLRGMSRRAARAVVAPLFAPFGLAGNETRFPSELSGGMRQRAAFLRTMAQDGRYLLLDEPFSALDAVTRLRLHDWLLARLRDAPCGLLMVTHDLFEATRLADRILVMSAAGRPGPGRIIADIAVPQPHSLRTEASMADLRETLKSLLLKEAP